jgi:hypothetical protein
VYNLHQHIKNDTDSTDVVENDYIFEVDKHLKKLSQLTSFLVFIYLQKCHSTFILYENTLIPNEQG